MPIPEDFVDSVLEATGARKLPDERIGLEWVIERRRLGKPNPPSLDDVQAIIGEVLV